MRVVPIVFLMLAGCSSALAQSASPAGVTDPPVAPQSILGTWIPVSTNRALMGHTDSAERAKLDVATRIKSSNVTKQDGGTFAGERLTTDGKTEVFVGAFQSDGRRFITASGADNSGFGVVEGDLMESCFVNVNADQHNVGCTIYRREK